MADSFLFDSLKSAAGEWRRSGYPCGGYPLIGEILAWQTEKQEDRSVPKYLREPQLLALDVYWYVRLVLKTPHILDIYRHFYGTDKKVFFEALGVSISRDALEWADIDGVIRRVKEDEGFVRDKRIQALHEAAKLDYPSYILALAMGAGKTVLIGAIVATEFAMSMRYPDGETRFMKNALVFAPGTTIIESLRELSGMPYDKVLPPGLNRDFLANLKIEFPGQEKDIQAQKGSIYNLIVTNTEKISLRAVPRKNQPTLIVERKRVQANLRLQKIASLPNLGVFSDEAHHTYGNTFDQLKRVRETINYIHEERPIVAVVNTTGTPYYEKQLLKEVVIWYGLGDGIRDNILKDINNGVHQYDIGRESDEEVFRDIVEEFFRGYGAVALPDGAKAKIAFYFKTQAHLEASRAFIERAMTGIGEDVSQVLVNTQKSSVAEEDDFKRLNNPDNRKRVILLIGKGVEGWNCPSLFACALIKEQTTSSNYVLQAATRCLRQVPGNTRSAKIFLDYGNARILDKQLQDNFRTDLGRLSAGTGEKATVTLRILKTRLPELEITRTVKRAVRKGTPGADIRLERPDAAAPPPILRSVFTPDFSGPGEILTPTGEMEELPVGGDLADRHAAAWRIASRYHLPILPILKSLESLYPEGTVPQSHLYGLFRQVEEQQANYGTVEERITEAMALIRVWDENGKDLFERDEDGCFVHRLRLLKRTHERMKDHGLLAESGSYEDKGDLSFHYTPYNFDSTPERSFFGGILSALDAEPDDVEAFLFTGGLTDPKKTDFHFEYLGEDRRYHRYFPDFVIVKKTGEFHIVEVKAESERGNVIVEAKKKAMERIQGLQPERFRYQIVYAPESTIGPREAKPVLDWINA